MKNAADSIKEANNLWKYFGIPATANPEEIDLQDYYAELLRIIYRNIFILYAEQRDMLPGSGTLYFQNFSLSSLICSSSSSAEGSDP